MKNSVNIISNKEWNIINQRGLKMNYVFKVIKLQTEEMISNDKGETFSLNNFASNASPSKLHAINENKNKSKIIIKDVDTGIGDGKFRIMITHG